MGYSGFLALSPSWGSAHTVFSTNTYRWTAAVEEDYRSTAADVCECHAASMGHHGCTVHRVLDICSGAQYGAQSFIIPKEALKFDIKKIDPISNAEKILLSQSHRQIVQVVAAYFYWGTLFGRLSESMDPFPTLLWSTLHKRCCCFMRRFGTSFGVACP